MSDQTNDKSQPWDSFSITLVTIICLLSVFVVFGSMYGLVTHKQLKHMQATLKRLTFVQETQLGYTHSIAEYINVKNALLYKQLNIT